MDELNYSIGNKPSGSSFNTLTQTFTWTPGFADAGNYPVTFYVSDGTDITSTIVNINVGGVNRPPVITPIAQIEVSEGELVSFTLSITDPDLDTTSCSVSNKPTGSSFNTGTCTFTWTPAQGSANFYSVIFTADDGNGGQNSINVDINVGGVNQPPVFDPDVLLYSINESQNINLIISATDADDDTITYSISNKPTSATFDSQTRVFDWTPDFGSDGNYQVLFTASDGNGGQDTLTLDITIGDVNRLPSFNIIGPFDVNESVLLSFVVSATDPDNDLLTYGAGNLPTGASFNSTTKTFDWTPDFGSDGNYDVVFTVDDGNGGQDTLEITINVGNVNRIPKFDNVGDKSVLVGETLTFDVLATDNDQNDILSYSISNKPLNAIFTNKTFSWTPIEGEEDNYNVVFTVDDGNGGQDTLIVKINVGGGNRPPEFGTIINQQVFENENLNFIITASDPDGDDVVIEVLGLPTGATFNNGNFNWTPGLGTEGDHYVDFNATDGKGGSDFKSIVITVGGGNRPPVIQDKGNMDIIIGGNFSFIISASDPDSNNIIIYSAVNLVNGSSFNISNGDFYWEPNSSYLGIENNKSEFITFIATDNGTPMKSDNFTIKLTVHEIPTTCSDGTPFNTCSANNKPNYCGPTGTLYSKSSECGCKDGYERDGEGCKKTVVDTPKSSSSGGGGGGSSICRELWSCGSWSSCEGTSLKNRTCVDDRACGTIVDKPSEVDVCSTIGIGTCVDGKMNGDESGIDCGGRCIIQCNTDELETVSDNEFNIQIISNEIRGELLDIQTFKLKIKNNGIENSEMLRVMLTKWSDEIKFIPNLFAGDEEEVEFTINLPGYIDEDLEVHVFYKTIPIAIKKIGVNLEVPLNTLKVNYYESKDQLYSVFLVDNRLNDTTKLFHVDYSMVKDEETYYYEQSKSYAIGPNKIYHKLQNIPVKNIPTGDYQVNSVLTESNGVKTKKSTVLNIANNKTPMSGKFLSILIMLTIIIYSFYVYYGAYKEV